MMDLFKAFDISASGMFAQRIRMNTIASNIANFESYTPEGEPFRKLVPVFRAVENPRDRTDVRVKVVSILQLPKTKLIYDPDHPYADAEGYVELPDIEPVKEMIDMIAAVRSYEANLKAFGMTRDIARMTLELWK